MPTRGAARRWLVGHANIGVAWLFALCYSVALVFASTWMVVTWAPQVLLQNPKRLSHAARHVYPEPVAAGLSMAPTGAAPTLQHGVAGCMCEAHVSHCLCS